MTGNTLVKVTPTTQLYKNPIAVRFFENLEQASINLSKDEKLTFPFIEKILGKPPVIPDSPDMDSKLEAWDELTKYSDKVLDIEAKIKTYAEKRA